MTTNTLRTQCETERRNHQWKQAAEDYSQLLDQEYHDGDEISLQIGLDLYRYAHCLIESVKLAEEGETGDDLEIAFECLETSKVGLEQLPADQLPPTLLVDVHELLAEIATINQQYEIAISEYQAALQIGLSNPAIHWNVPLSSQYMLFAVLETAGKYQEANDAVNEAIKFIDSQLSKTTNQEEVELLRSYRAEVITRRDQIAENL